MKVYVAGHDRLTIEMYELRGWDITDIIKGADLVQFTGGVDVDPSLYGQVHHPYTSINKKRDYDDTWIYDNARRNDVPTVGICRGGQFLNVKNGGSLYQHVDGHAIGGTHLLYDVESGREYQVASTHHQMMRPGPEGVVVADAGNRATFKEFMEGEEVIRQESPLSPDTEVVFYPENESLCVQFHPEFVYSKHESVDYFFELLEGYLGV